MKKLLAIDDQNDNLVTISAVVNTYLSDCKILTSLSGIKGIELARKELPDVILLDIIMPLMNGYETCRLLKEDELTKHIPIIMITAIKIDAKSRIKALSIGADAFLSKPIDPVELSAQVKVMLRIKGAEDKLRAEKGILKQLVDERTIELTKKNKILSNEINRREKAEVALQSIATKFSAISGIELFEKVCLHLSNTLSVEFAFIGEIIEGQNIVNVKAGVQNGNPLNIFQYDLLDTPCDNTRMGKICSYPSGVQSLFPKDTLLVDLNIESYIGIPLVGTNGDVLGLMVLIDTKSLEEEEIAKSLLQIFSARVAAEMERIQSEEALSESEENNRLIIENAPFCIYQIDLNGNIITINQAGLSMLGDEKENEVIGSSYLDEVGNKDSERISAILKSAFIGNASTFEFSGHNGNIYSSSFVPIKDKEMVVRILGITQDITEQRQSVERIKESEEKYRNLVDRANDGICIIQNNVLKYANNCLGEIWGGAPEDLVNTVFTDYVFSEELDKVTSFFQRRINDQDAPSIFETILLNKKGNLINVELSAGLITYMGDLADLVFIRDVTDRKKAEAQISKLSAAVEQSPSVITITDLDGNIEYVNKKFSEITGYSSDDCKGKNVNMLTTGLQSGEYYKELWKTIKAGKIWKGEFHNKKKNNEFIWESASIFPIFDENGDTINYIKVAEDITERKVAEAALKESEEKYHKLIGTTSEGFWLINSKGETLEVNQSLCNMLAYSKEEILGKTPYDFVDDENLKIFKDQIAQAAKQQHRNYEILLRGKNNVFTPTLFNATSINDNRGQFAGSFAFVTDISERKRAEQIQKVLFNISNAVITSGNLNKLISQIQIELGTIIDTTNFYVAMYNKENDSFSFPFYSDQNDVYETVPAAKTLTKYVVETEKSLLANTALINQFVEEGKIEILGSSSKIWLGVPLKTEGKVTGAFVVQSYDDEDAYDESDMEMLEFVSDQISISINRKKAVEDLIGALEKATESDRLKTAFLQNVSHEIRTPMNGILGFAALLNDPSLSGEEQHSYIEIITSSGKRMLNTLNDLMDISMLETDQVKLNIANINVNNELDILFDFFKLEVQNKGLEFSYFKALPSSEVEIKTDKQKFYAVLSNLIKNAIKYCHEGSIEFGYHPKGQNIEFFVKDTGLGIPIHRQNAIFDRFVQADIEDVKVYEGSGLGLSISKAYVELLGGKIWVESVEGVGSQFYFTLPLQNSADLENNLPDKPAYIELNNQPNNLKILIAEDEEFAMDYLRIVLGRFHSKLLFATNGLEVVQLCKDNPDIDLILMDIKMPLMSGYEATRKIREFNKSVVIIAQTAYAIEGDKNKVLNVGCDDYISKPINSEKLLEMISKHFKNQ
jgi:PAS domain S-box-containing protein